MRTKRNLALTGLAVALGGLLVAMVEAAGRAFPRLMPVQWQIEYFFIHYPFVVVPDAELGFSMPPNQREMIRTDDYSFLAETDSRGYPNRDPWPDNPSVVFLGDSFLVGAGVGLDGIFTGLVARSLSKHSVLNLGLAAAGPARQRRIYQRFGGDWRPALVVGCLFLASDVENDEQFLAWLGEGGGADYNRFRLSLARDARYKGILQRFLDKSWLLYRAQQVALRIVQGQDYAEPRRRFADGTEILFERHALEFATKGTAPDDPRLATFMASVSELRDTVEASGAAFVVMLIPSKEELFGATPAQARENLAARIKERLSSKNVAVLDLYGALAAGGARQAPYFRKDIHLNAHGNHIVAAEFSAWFARFQESRN